MRGDGIVSFRGSCRGSTRKVHGIRFARIAAHNIHLESSGNAIRGGVADTMAQLAAGDVVAVKSRTGFVDFQQLHGIAFFLCDEVVIRIYACLADVSDTRADIDVVGALETPNIVSGIAFASAGRRFGGRFGGWFRGRLGGRLGGWFRGWFRFAVVRFRFEGNVDYFTSITAVIIDFKPS